MNIELNKGSFNMEKVKKWYYEKIGNKTVENLEKNEFKALYFSNKDDAKDYIKKIAENYNSVGFGGSITVVNELEIDKMVKEAGKEVLNHNRPELSLEEKLVIRKKQLTCDLFITSANAVTKDGKIVNVDGIGNRVAASIFGPKKILIVAGVNKITKDIHAALKRVKEIAAPMNANRLGSKTPCAETGECVDCKSPGRICRVTVIMDKKPKLSDMEVIIIGENLGY
jgi:L-lactate utilization protein LutB